MSFNLNSIYQFIHAPIEDHFHALKCILYYVKGTTYHELQIHKQSTCDLLAYSDADWAESPDTSCSTIGYAIFFVYTNLISRFFKK
jgi:hypothetical protein